MNATVLVRPVYNNAHVANAAQWRADNAQELERYYRACDEALRAGGAPAETHDEFDYFVRVQYERAAVTALASRRDL